jgi:hypothetical protein
VAICLWLSAPGAFGQVSPCPLPDLPTCKERLTEFWYNLYAPTKVPKLSKQFGWKLLAKAQPDECFQGLGNPANLGDPNNPIPGGLSFWDNYPGDLDSDQIWECASITEGLGTMPTGIDHALPKVNQAYVWGLVQARDRCNKPLNQLWFGTLANTVCIASSDLGLATTLLNPSFVCEAGTGGNTDSRPPRVFYYDTKKNKLSEATKDIRDGGCLGYPPDYDRDLLERTTGLRSAGAARGVVFIGGIVGSSAGGGASVTMFAFDACTKQYLGGKSFDQYNNIRQWRFVNGELYVGVGKSGGGEVLRWTGKKSCCEAELFKFETVANLPADPAYLTEHKGRLYVSTWGVPAQILMSPPFGPDKKLTWEDASVPWEEVFNLAQYEPELSALYTTVGAALMSYQGCLYWGTMTVPGLAFQLWNDIYGAGASDEDKVAAILGTYRPISIFRGCCLDDPAKRKVEVLYGFSCLPVYEPGNGWRLARNNLDQDPKYGLGGFGNFFNTYAWWAEVFKDKLFFGTFDFLYLGAAFVRDEIEFPEKITKLFEQFYGADVWVFPAKNTKAQPLSRNGVGNYANYGIRTMVSTPSALYLGSANAMNLMTDRYDDRPEGGWELIKLFAK